ncbi:MAG: DUF2059 domain-containing protein [Alkalimonas sp.]|nr:DUF2059 domain-containing protein [Alkalimonas sp.]
MLKKSLVFAALLCCAPLKAEPVYQLLEVMGGQEQIAQMQEQMVQMMAGSNPVLAQYEAVLADWTRTYMTWEQMREPMAALYNKHFSKDEIEQLIEFYQSPVGAKSVHLMPQLFAEGAQIGMELAERHQPELLRMLQEAGLDLGN